MPEKLEARSLPRVAATASVAALKAEMKARGLKGYSNMNKEQLVRALAEGSIMLSATKEFTVVEDIKKIMAAEQRLRSEADASKKRQLDSQRQDKERKRQKSARPENDGRGNFSFPPAQAARTKAWSGRPSSHFHHVASHCDDEEEAAVLHKFPKKIRKPPSANLNRAKPLEYTVWTSAGYDRDGFHSYSGPPEREWNSSWSTVNEANRRIEYVFYCKNPWGMSMWEITGEHVELDDSTGLWEREVCPEDSERWTVGGVHSTEFKSKPDFGYF